MGCDNLTEKETVVDLLNDCELTDDYQLDGEGFYYLGYSDNKEPVYYSTEGFDSLRFTPLGLASHQLNFTKYLISTNSSSNIKTVNISLSYINFQIEKYVTLENFTVVCGFHEKEKPIDDFLLVDSKEYKVNLSGDSIIQNTKKTNMKYFSCLLFYNYNSNPNVTKDIISNYTISITELDFNMMTSFSRNATHLNGDIKISFIDWKTCENDSISLASLKCNYFTYIPTNSSSFDSVDKIKINCNGTNVLISTKIMEYEYFSCMLSVNNKTIIHTNKVPPPPNNIKIVPAMTIYEQKDKIRAYGSASFKDWSNCDSDSLKYKLYCNFGTANEINGTVIQAQGISINCTKTMVPLIETKEMSKIYLICQIRDEKDKILAYSNVKALKAPIILFDNIDMVYNVNDKKMNAFGDIRYIWSDCYHSSVVVHLSCGFFGTIPTIDSFFDIETEVDCDKTSINYYSEDTAYFGCLLSDQHLKYAFNYTELPRFVIRDLTNATYDINSGSVNGFVNKGNVKFDKWKDCSLKSLAYKLYCDYHPNINIVVDTSKFVDINCNGNDLNVVATQYYYYFSCVIVNPTRSNEIVYTYRRALATFHHNDLQIFTRTAVCDVDVNNNNLLVKGSDLINCNDLAGDDLYYICESYKVPPISMGLFNLLNAKKYSCSNIEINEVITNGDRSYGCLIYNRELMTQVELFALEAPSFDLSDIKFSFDENYEKVVAKGNVKYIWNNCVNTNNKIFFDCKIFDHKPKYDEFDKDSTVAINCTGIFIHFESVNLNMRYLGCEVYGTDYYTATSIRYIDLPRITMSTVYIHSKSITDKNFIVEGIILSDWKTCSKYESKSQLYCALTSEYPQIKDIVKSSTPIDFKCDFGMNISSYQYTIDKIHNYFGCVLKNKETNELYGFSIKEHFELDVNDLKVEQLADGEKSVVGRVGYKFDTCSSNGYYYKQICKFSSKIDINEFDFNLGTPIDCNGIEINMPFPESNYDYFMCIVYNLYNPLSDYTFAYININQPTSKPTPISSNTIFIIIGTCVGGCLLIVLFGLMIYCMCLRKRNLKRSEYEGYSNFI